MTISEAIKTGKTRITCTDGTTFEVRPLKSGDILLHHFEKEGKQMFNNRYKMSVKDAEIFVKKKRGGIAEIEDPVYDTAIPDRNDKAPESIEPIKAAQNKYEFEDEEPEEAEEENAAEAEQEEVNADPDPIPIEEDEDEFEDEVSFGETEEEPEAEPEPEPEETPEETEEEPELEEEQTETEQPVEKKEESYIMPEMTSEKYSIIYEEMEMEGDIKTAGSVEIRGTLKGNIGAEGNIKVSGCVAGDIKAGNNIQLWTADGEGAELSGNIEGKEVVIEKNCVVIGNIKAEALLLEGMVKGDIDVKTLVEVRGTAKVKGNIVSRTVTIDEGAALDGMCVQKYTEGTPDNFFDSYTLKITGQPLNPKAVEKKAEEKRKEADEMTVSQMIGTE